MAKRKPTKKQAKHYLDNGIVPSLNSHYFMVIFEIGGKKLKSFFQNKEETDVFVRELALLGIEPNQGYPKKRKTKKRELTRRQQLIEKELEVVAEAA